MLKKSSLLLLLPFLISCSKHKPVREQGNFERGSIYKTDKNSPIPNQLVAHIEKIYIERYRLDHPESPLTDLQLSIQIPRRLMNIKVFLKEKTEGTLFSNSMFDLPIGGGSVNLGEYVNDGKGLFYLDFDFPKAEFSIDELRVFFVSHSIKRKIAGKEFGAGCGKAFEITKFFHEKIRPYGLELIAADARYLGQISGSFIFAHIGSSALYVGSSSFFDSRYPEFSCLNI